MPSRVVRVSGMAAIHQGSVTRSSSREECVQSLRAVGFKVARTAKAIRITVLRSGDLELEFADLADAEAFMRGKASFLRLLPVSANYHHPPSPQTQAARAVDRAREQTRKRLERLAATTATDPVDRKASPTRVVAPTGGNPEGLDAPTTTAAAVARAAAEVLIAVDASAELVTAVQAAAAVVASLEGGADEAKAMQEHSAVLRGELESCREAGTEAQELASQVTPAVEPEKGGAEAIAKVISGAFAAVDAADKVLGAGEVALTVARTVMEAVTAQEEGSEAAQAVSQLVDQAASAWERVRAAVAEARVLASLGSAIAYTPPELVHPGRSADGEAHASAEARGAGGPPDEGGAEEAKAAMEVESGNGGKRDAREAGLGEGVSPQPSPSKEGAKKRAGQPPKKKPQVPRQLQFQR